MDYNYPDIYEHIDKIIRGNGINLSACNFIRPWGLIIICLLLVERHASPDKKILLPSKPDALRYLKMAHFDTVLKILGYTDNVDLLRSDPVGEKENLNILEISCCRYRDDFSARLDRLYKVFKNIGLDENQARLIAALVGELGNNVYDHNLGNWPTDISGCFITAQNYSQRKCLEFVIGDPGIGFLGSLKNAYPDLKDDLGAIKLGLSGKTGWIDTKRGNGLLFVQKAAFERFSGEILIHSGNGLVIIGKDGMKERKVNKIMGTAIRAMLYY